MPIMQALGNLRQEDCHEFKASVDHTVIFQIMMGDSVRSHLNSKSKQDPGNKLLIYLKIKTKPHVEKLRKAFYSDRSD